MGRKVIITKQQPKPAQTHQTPTSLEKSLFALLIFTIPTNLALGFLKDRAYVNGILVDYLIPKLYISDIIVILLITAWLTRIGIRTILKFKTNKNTTLILSLFTLTTLSTLQAAKPEAAWWYLLKILEMVALTVWIAQNSKHLNLQKPISLTLLFQAAIAIIQWIQKKSLLGYLFLGETTLKASSHVARTSVTGEIRPLPYGTTPHPNVLAGFITISLLILLITYKDSPYKGISKYIKDPTLTISILLALIALLLTQSISAILALILAATIIISRPLWSKSSKRTLLMVSCFLLLAASSTIFFSSSFLKSESVTRRVALAKISLEMIASKPILGVGPNNFTAAMSKYGDIAGTTRFFQPVHNICLLVISEFGLLPILLVSVILYKSRFWLSSFDWTRSAPVIALLFIGLLDHYPITLQTGQILMALAIGMSVKQQQINN